jgi:hypothetical protein
VLAACRSPIFLSPVLQDPERVRALVEGTAPHLPVQRYFASGAEMRAQSGPEVLIIAPNFRADWATLSDRVPGVELLLEHPGLRDAAAQLFGSEHVVPWGVYANITYQLPFDQGRGHTDVPAFVGFDRSRVPTWFLAVLGHSGLFEEERVEIATAVSWWYRGEDGGFTYWPDGPDQPPKVHEGKIFNTAIVGDSDRMFHRVRPVGRREDGMPKGLSLDSEIVFRGGEAWAIREAGRPVAAMSWEALRISVSWKAYVYRDAAQRRKHEEGQGGLDLDAVMARLLADLRRQGREVAPPADPYHDEAFVDVLREAYVREPRMFEA